MSAATPHRASSRISGDDGGRNSAQFDQPVDREHADAAAIGQDRQPLARRRFEAAQRLGAVEQLAQIGDPQHAGALERGIVDRVRTCQRAGMGCGRLGALRHAAGFDDDDRLDPAAARAADMNFRASLIASI